MKRLGSIGSNPLALFFFKIIGFYLAWFLVYELWLLPAGQLDEILSKNIVATSAGILHLVGEDVLAYGRMIAIGEAPGVYIADGCNGLAAIGLFIGFLVAYPGDNLRRIAFLFVGIGIIYLSNIFRIVILTLTQVYWSYFFTFTHDFSMKVFFYLVIFLLWVLWANQRDERKAIKPAGLTK